MGSFNGKSFEERGNLPNFPIWNAIDTINERIKPSNTSELQEIGNEAQTLALTVKATAAQLMDLYDQVLESGSLVYAWETHNALLISVTSAAEQGAGHDVYFATLNLVRL